MDKENVVSIHHGVLLSHKEERPYVIYRKMGGTEDHHDTQDKPSSKRHSYVESRPKIMMMTMTMMMGREYKRETVWGAIREGMGEDRPRQGSRCSKYIHLYTLKRVR
jgi:hypothetical protein